VPPNPIRLPELTELQTFLATAEEGSVSKAARRLQISPAAATKRIDNLEALARGKLFTRTSRGAHLTQFGRCLLPRAQQVLCEVEGMLTEPADDTSRQLEGVRRALRSARIGPTVEELLADTEQLLAHVFDLTADGLVITDHAGVVIEVDEVCCRLSGYGRHELVGRPADCIDLWSWSDEDERRAATTKLAEDRQISGTGQLRTRNGERRDAHYSSRLVEIARAPYVLTCIRAVVPERGADRDLPEPPS
jgi:PAS domain S-box-containing protein